MGDLVVNRFITKAVFFFILWTSAFGIDAAELDIMLVYDSGVSDQEKGVPNTLARSWIEEANIIYQNNNVDIQLNLVGLHAFDGGASNNVDDLLRNVTNSE